VCLSSRIRTNVAIRFRVVRLARQLTEGDSRRLPANRMLWKRTALMRFALFSTISFSSFQCGLSKTAVTPRSWGSH
jgi:hypothetical protein